MEDGKLVPDGEASHRGMFASSDGHFRAVTLSHIRENDIVRRQRLGRKAQSHLDENRRI